MLAFVFVRVEVEAGSGVASEIVEIEGVSELHQLTGDIDLIVKVSARDIDELSKIIFQIRGVRGVLGTDTRIVLASILQKGI